MIRYTCTHAVLISSFMTYHPIWLIIGNLTWITGRCLWSRDFLLVWSTRVYLLLTYLLLLLFKVRFAQPLALWVVFCGPLFLILMSLISSNFPYMDWFTIKVSSNRLVAMHLCSTSAPPFLYIHWYSASCGIGWYNRVISKHIFLFTVLCIFVSRCNDKHALISSLLSYFD